MHTSHLSYLKAYFSYDPESGHLTALKTGNVVTCLDSGGYLIFTYMFEGEQFNCRVHRVAWLIHYGEVPPDQVDHIDGNRQNNRIANLRLATNQQNQFNRKKADNLTSKYRGVAYYKAGKKWTAQLHHNRKKIHLGYFHDEKEAAEAYNKKAVELWGEYAKLNVI